MDTITAEERDFLISTIAEALDDLSNEAQKALFFGVHAEDDETGEPYATLDSEGGNFLTECLSEALRRFVRRTESDVRASEAMDRWVTTSRHTL